MKKRYLTRVLILTLACSGLAGTALPHQLNKGKRMAAHTFGWKGRDFLLDGKPFTVRSGEMHYPRVPRQYWRDRFRKARAMGLNTITTYVFWNLHAISSK